MTTKNPKPAAPGDDRLKRSSSPEVRGARGISEDAERTQPSALLSETDLERIIESEFDQSALPTAPLLPGWHVVWLTSQSQYDSLQKRERLGYQPVLRDEMSNFDPSNGQRLGNMDNYITCNEMVLYKIEEARYQAIMRHFHHKKPMQEEASIADTIRAGMQKDSSGKELGSFEGEGIQDLETGVQYAARQNPVFN